MHTRQITLDRGNHAPSPSHEVDRSSRPQDKNSGLPEKAQTPVLTTTIGWMLQVGVAVSSTIILVGLLLLFMRSGATGAQSIEDIPHTLSQVWTGLLVLQPAAIIALGLLLLIATPVLRVLVSIFAFRVERDRHFVLISMLLLLILLASFMLGKGGA